VGRRAVIVVGVLLLLATGCGGSSAVNNPRVLLIGDSILFSAEQPVDAALKHVGWQPVVAAVPGSRIESWPIFTAGFAAQQHPAIAVVELGTNNCSLSGGCVPLQGQIDDLMKQLHSVQDVLWLNVQQDVPLTKDAEYVNSQLEMAAQRWPKMKIVDFSDAFAHHPSLHQPDRVHLSPKGVAALTKLIVDSLDGYIPKP
jgi:GDSL-like lipase/acylhydrolase family protein